MRIDIDKNGNERMRLTVREQKTLATALGILKSLAKHGNEYAATAAAAMEDVPWDALAEQ